MPFEIIRNDITKVHADAIVNAANSSLLGDIPVSSVHAGDSNFSISWQRIGHFYEKEINS